MVSLVSHDSEGREQPTVIVCELCLSVTSLSRSVDQDSVLLMRLQRNFFQTAENREEEKRVGRAGATA